MEIRGSTLSNYKFLLLIVHINRNLKRFFKCPERKNEYLIADKDFKGGCTKLKELKKKKKDIQMIIYNDGSLAIKDTMSGGVLFYAKPNIKGKGPFSVGITRELKLQIIDSQDVVVWNSTAVFEHYRDMKISKVRRLILF